MTQYAITVEDSSDPDDIQSVRDGLTAYNLQFLPDAEYKPLQVFLRGSDGNVVGGLIGTTSWGWLYVYLFWVDESLRQNGHGSRMLAMAEQEALRRGCHHAQLDTLDFQAPDFYENQGYIIWGELEDFPIGHKRYFYKKELGTLND